jgi:hypothetical protein
VVVARGVGTFHLAQLALITKVDDAIFLGSRQIADVIALGVNRLEEIRERRAKIEAQPAAVTDVEDALDFDFRVSRGPNTSARWDRR